MKNFSNFKEPTQKEKTVSEVLTEIAENMAVISSTFQASEQAFRERGIRYEYQNDNTLMNLIKKTEDLAQKHNITFKMDLSRFIRLVDEDNWNASDN